MKTVILLDYGCLEEAAKQLDVEIDIKEFLRFLAQLHPESEIQTPYAYVDVDERMPHIKDKITDELTRAGFLVREVIGQNLGINFISNCNQIITLDAMRAVYENSATNIILVSNSALLTNLVTILREKDVFVETVFYGSLVDYDLAIKSSGFIDLDNFIFDDHHDYCEKSMDTCDEDEEQTGMKKMNIYTDSEEDKIILKYTKSHSSH